MLKKFEIPSILLKLGTTASFFAICTLGIPCSIEAQASPLAQTAIDFTDVAKKSIPSVVSIKVKASAKKEGSSNLGGSDDNDSLNDFFGDDFLKRFFGLPYSKNQEHDQNQQAPIVGQASGFLISSNGQILTNSHVVKDAGEIIVVLNDGREFQGKVIGQDPNTDIAVVKIDAKDLPYLTFADSDKLEVGQWAIAIGNPLGLQASFTVGVVSATGRNNLDLTHIEDFIQTDAAINRGNSGGPLLNIESQVIGMNTAIVTNMATGGYMGIGFAIPSNLLDHIMQEIVSTGKVTRGYLGVVLQQMDMSLAKAFNLDKAEGALIAEIAKNSPAEKSGLKQGDIVLKYNNQPVINIASLRNAVALMKPGSSVNLLILREGKTTNVSVEVGNFPTESHPANVETKENKFGFSVKDLTPELAKSLGYHGEKGVVVSTVDAGSIAAWAGIKKGSLILAVNQKKVTSAEEFNQALSQVEKGKPLLLLVKQGDIVRFVSLQAN